MAEEKSNFIVRPPFKKVQEYRWWIKATLFLVLAQVIVLGYFSFKKYSKKQYLILEKNKLEKILSDFDDIVRKKNKLLDEQDKGLKYSKRNKDAHQKILNYLNDVEKVLGDIHLSAFEIKGSKISLNGYSNDLEKISKFILDLQQLEFVKKIELDHISKDKKATNGKLRFIIDLKV